VQLYGCVFNLPHTVTRSVLLDSDPAEVWEALTDETALSEWLAPEVELEPREGGRVRCRYEDGSERRGEVELVEEAERLSFHWRREGGEPSRVELSVDAVAGGTRVTVIETAGRRADLWSRSPHNGPSTAVGGGWASRLGALRMVVGRLVLA
jgi:uncharacterized protein YndB with AHSA1/START domain